MDNERSGLIDIRAMAAQTLSAQPLSSREPRSPSPFNVAPLFATVAPAPVLIPKQDQRAPMWVWVVLGTCVFLVGAMSLVLVSRAAPPPPAIAPAAVAPARPPEKPVATILVAPPAPAPKAEERPKPRTSPPRTARAHHEKSPAPTPTSVAPAPPATKVAPPPTKRTDNDLDSLFQ